MPWRVQSAIFNWEIRDRSYEDQECRASGLNLVVAAILLWNTVYLAEAAQHLRRDGVIIKEEDLQHVSPLGWEHINLTGDFHWHVKQVPPNGQRAATALKAIVMESASRSS